MSLFGPMPWPISICANCKVWILCNMLFTSEDLESNHNKRKSIYCINNLILNKVQVILFGDWLRNFLQNLHELFCQFISWTNRVNSGKFMDNCWISCQVMADMKKVYDDLIIINLNWPTLFYFISAAVQLHNWCHTKV